MTRTLWCPDHRPPSTVPRLNWRVNPLIFHPGRPDHPSEEVEARSQLPTTLPAHPLHVVGLAMLEESRWRIVLEVRRLTLWALRHDHLTPTTDRHHALAAYIHDTVTSLRSHPSPNLRVTRPTTPDTWVRRLHTGVLELRHAAKWPVIHALLRGYHALAPAPSQQTQRGVAQEWQQAMDDVLRSFQRRPTTTLAALWLTLELQRSGFRPKTAVRGTLPQAQRERQRIDGVYVWRISVTLDKDNPVGQLPAPRRRWIPSTTTTDRIMQHLPYGSTQDDYERLKAARRQVLAARGITQTYAARRDAAEAAERLDLPVAALLNHRPNSASTPGYANTATPTSLLRALMQNAAASASPE